MSARNALILAFLLSDVVFYLVLRSWQADHPDDGRPARRGRGRTTIYDPKPDER